MIFLLHKGRSGADQCDQDTRPTSIVCKNKEKIRTQIVESIRIRSYMLQEGFGLSSSPGLHGRGAGQDVILPIV